MNKSGSRTETEEIIGRPKLYKTLIENLGQVLSAIEVKISEIECKLGISPIEILKYLKELRKKLKSIKNEVEDLRTRYLILLKTKKKLKNEIKQLKSEVNKLRDELSKFNIQIKQNISISEKEFQRRFWYAFKIIISYDQLKIKTQMSDIVQYNIDYFLYYFNKNIDELKKRFNIDTKILEEIRDTLLNRKLTNKEIGELNDKLRDFLIKFLLSS